MKKEMPEWYHIPKGINPHYGEIDPEPIRYEPYTEKMEFPKYSTRWFEVELDKWNNAHPDKKKRDIFCRGDCWNNDFRCPHDPGCND